MSDMSVVETLKAARNLIANEEHWCQGNYAIDGGDVKVGPNSYKAYAFCAIGALCRAARKGAGTITLHPAYSALSGVTPGTGFVPNFNDSHTHAEVLAAFDEAIRVADSREEK